MPDTFDVTPEQADRWNRLTKGESVDVPAEDVELFQKLSAARKQQSSTTQAALQPSFQDRALGVLGHVAESIKGMVTPSRGESEPVRLKEPQRAQFPDDRSYIEALALYGQHLAQRPAADFAAFQNNENDRLAAIFNGIDITGLGAKAADLIRPGAQRAFDEAGEKFPKTALGAGAAVPLGPLGSSAKTVIPTMGAIGAINAKAHGRDPLAGGAVNAAAAAVLHGGFSLAGKAVSPLLKSLHERAAMGEPVTKVGPLDLDERGTVPDWQLGEATARRDFNLPTRADRPYFAGGQELTDARVPRGERETAVREVPTQKLTGREVTKTGVKAARADALRAEPRTDVLLDPEQTNSGTNVGEVTNAQRPYFKEADARAESVRASEAPTYVTNLPGEASTDAKLKSIDALLDSEGRVHPSVDPTLKPSGSYYSEANRLELQKSFGTKTPAAYEKTGVKGRDDLGTRSMKVPVREVAQPPKSEFESALDWLEGNDIGTEKTKTRYVPADSLQPESIRDPERTHIPSGRLQAPIGGGSGDNPRAKYVGAAPAEPGPIQPNEVPDSFNALAGEARATLAQDASKWEAFKRSLSLPENRAGADVAAAIRGLKASKAMHDVAMEKLYPRLQESLKQLTPSERANVRRIVSGLRDRKLGMEEVSKLPAEFRDLFVRAQREQQAMMLDLAKKGYFSAQEMSAIKKTLDSGQLHLHRSYQAFLAKKGFLPTRDALEKAARFFAEENGIDARHAYAQVVGVMKDLMRSEGPRSPNTVAQLFRDRGLLKKRSLPPQLRGLLGVVNDPSFIVADTSAELAQMYHQARVTEALAAPQNEGIIWSNDPRPGMDERRLWNESLGLEGNRRAYGALAGRYVAPQLYEAMTQFSGPQARSFIAQLSNAAVGWFSFAKVISSPATLMRNLLSNSFNLMVSGVPFHRWPMLLGQAASALRAEGKNLSLKEAGPAQWARMAFEDYATPQGRGTDWGGAEARRIIEDVIRESPNGIVGVFDKLFRKYNGTRVAMGKVYEMGDTLPRLAAYMYHVQDGVKSLGLSEAVARSRASQIVNRYFATGASVGPAFRGLSQSGLAPFGSWFVDNMRVTKNIMADAARGQFGPALRAALFTAVPMGAFYGLRQWYGVTDAEVSAAERRLKGSWRDRNAFHDWFPVRGKDGLTYAVSFDGLNPLSVFFKGPEGSFPKNIAANVAQGMTQSGWAEPFMDLMLAKLGIAPTAYQGPVLPGQEGWKFANDVQAYMTPTLMNQFMNVARKAQLSPELLPLRSYEEPQSLGSALFTSGPLQPLSIEKVGPRTMEGARKQVQGQYGELKDAKKAANKLPAEERAKVINEAQRRIEELRKKQSSR